MNQGNDSDQFIGSKFRIQRIRVNYDLTTLTLTSGFRMMLVIPKDPNVSFATSGVPIFTTSDQVNTDEYTVLHDQLMSNDASLRAGTFDWVGPLNVEMNKAGTTCQRNNVHLFFFSDSAGTDANTQITYSVWFTDN